MLSTGALWVTTFLLLSSAPLWAEQKRACEVQAWPHSRQHVLLLPLYAKGMPCEPGDPVLTPWLAPDYANKVVSVYCDLERPVEITGPKDQTLGRVSCTFHGRVAESKQRDGSWQWTVLRTPRPLPQ